MKRMRTLSLGAPATQVMGALRSGRPAQVSRQHYLDKPMGDLLSGITTGLSNTVSQAPNQLLSLVVGNVASQPAVKAAEGTAAKNAAASSLATQITNILNNPTQLAIFGGGALVAFIVLSKVLK